MSNIIFKDLDVSALLGELSSNSKYWKEDTFYKTIADVTFRDIDCITLRYANEGSNENKDSLIYKEFPLIQSAVFDILGLLHGERLGGVMINRLSPGSTIPLHSDGLASNAYYHRFHLVLQTNDGVTTLIDNELYKMGVGEVWWFDHTKEHTITNNGDTDRIHLIVDIRLPLAEVQETPDTDTSGLCIGWEHYLADQVYIKQMALPLKGMLIKGHSHTYDHISLLSTGSVAMFSGGEYLATYIAPTGILVPANKEHEFLALSDTTVLYCIHNTHDSTFDLLEETLVVGEA